MKQRQQKYQNQKHLKNLSIYNGDEKTDSKPEENKEKSEDETAE